MRYMHALRILFGNNNYTCNKLKSENLLIFGNMKSFTAPGLLVCVRACVRTVCLRACASDRARASVRTCACVFDVCEYVYAHART